MGHFFVIVRKIWLIWRGFCQFLCAAQRGGGGGGSGLTLTGA